MGFQQAGQIRYYTFERLLDSGLINAVFTRAGGVSEAPYASLNLGSTVGDFPEHVKANVKHALNSLDLSVDSIYDVWQVHGDRVVIADHPRPPGQPHKKADVILTDQAGVSLLMRFADCVPILLYDPNRRVVGLAHAGWKGTILGTARRAVLTMTNRYGSNPGDIVAAIGPSIAKHHYEVGPEVAAQVVRAFGQNAEQVLESGNGVHAPGLYFDLWRANRIVLESAGVKQVEIAGLCTACNPGDWYSHRAEHGVTGRFGALIALKPD
jgi:YfiH family protein